MLDRLDAAHQASVRLSMKNTPLLKFFLVGMLFTMCATLATAEDTPAPEVSQPNTNDVSAQDTQRMLVQLQEQIQAVQLAIERGQQDAQAAIRHNAEDMAARFQLLEKSLNVQRAAEFEAMQRTNHLTLLVAGIFAAVMFVVMLFAAYFQWRIANRLAELSSVRPTLLTLANSRALSETGAGGPAASSEAVEQANARLLGVVEQLQRRIVEFEQLAHMPLKDKTGSSEARAGKV
jgi:hypothetical protein